jgi:cyclophilin family peptidyl-prolyl cis-trans isomerase
MYKFLIPLFALALLIGCSPAADTPTPDSNPTPDNAMTDESSQETSMNAVGFNGQLATGKHTVVMKTSKGDITLEIDADAAPKAATNFLVLSQMGYYNGLGFHRIIQGFMIQGGDPEGTGAGGSSIFGDSFEDEPNDLQMERGMIAMANRGPNTNGSQFFIIQAPAGTPWLQGRHTIFGRVTDGMDVVDAIAAVPVNQNDNKPLEPVTYDIEVQN